MKKRAISLFLCLVLCLTCLSGTTLAAAERITALEENLATSLKLLGLFQGVTETNFDLRRAPTRTEAIVMLIRMLGKEDAANSRAWRHPFLDVPDWADRYVGYAYQKDLTNGESVTRFGTGPASAQMYVTFMLRALGYSDENDLDFTWTDPFSLAKNIGILPEGTDTEDFWRADVVRISYAALEASVKGSGRSLADELISQGVFTREAYRVLYKSNIFDIPYSEKTELTAKQIYALCSPAVFCIRTYDANGNSYAQGSGFFIDGSGVAVTNHHVLENALSARALLTDGRTLDIAGVLFYDAGLDYVVLQVEGSGFSTLTVGNSSQVMGGETIYTLGNPMGLTNTITSGIVSNPRRDDYNGMIQFDAPISNGSSGGALINAYGEVIGITTGTITSGQNLNFAVPINDAVLGMDVAHYAGEHGIISMEEYARQNGYISGGQPSVPQQPQQPPAGGRSGAINALKSYVWGNFNDSGDNYRGFVLYDDTSNAKYGLYYRESQADLVLVCSDDPEGGYGCLYLDDDSTTVTARFAYHISDTAGEASVSGGAVLDAADIYPGAAFSFTDYSGPPSQRTEYEALAMTMLCDAVAFAGRLFDEFISGSYSVGALGFKDF